MQRNRGPFRSVNAEVNSSVSSAGSINGPISSGSGSPFDFGIGTIEHHSYEERPRSPSLVVRMTGTVMRNKRDIAWGIRLIQKVSDWCLIRPSQETRDIW